MATVVGATVKWQAAVRPPEVPPMPCDIQVDPVARVVHARYRGEVTLKQRHEMAGQVLARAEAGGFDRVLLDFRAAQSLESDPDATRRIADTYAPRIGPDMRLAYLVRYDYQVDPSVEALGRERGVRVERFNDLDAAMAWLQERDTPVATPEATGAAAAPPAPGAADIRRTMRLAAEIAGAPLSPEQFAALGGLVHDLLAAGIPEDRVREMAGRLSEAMRQGEA